MVKNILILAAHPDDAEFSCAGTVKRFTDSGATAWYAALSPCTKSIPEGFHDKVLFDEMESASAHLGIAASNLLTYDFPVREFPRYRQEILEEFVKLRKQIDPDLVFVPNSDDLHQDHHQVYLEGVRAFKMTRLLGYEFPWNNMRPVTNVHVALERKHIDAKWDAISEYATQQGRRYSDKEMIYGLARVRGRQCGCDYAEGFEAIHWLL